MANPQLFFGLIAAVITAALTYWFKKKLKITLFYSLIAFLMIGTILHFIITPSVIALLINCFFYNRFKKNWSALLLSIPGVLIVLLIFSLTINLFIQDSVSGSMSLGQGLGVGIGMGLAYILMMMLGLVSYFVSLLVITIIRAKAKK